MEGSLVAGIRMHQKYRTRRFVPAEDAAGTGCRAASMRVTMKHFRSGDRKVEWDGTPTSPGKDGGDVGWIGYTIFVRKREVHKCASEGCLHLTPNELCKSCNKLRDEAYVMNPNFRFDHGGGVSSWMDEEDIPVATSNALPSV